MISPDKAHRLDGEEWSTAERELRALPWSARLPTSGWVTGNSTILPKEHPGAPIGRFGLSYSRGSLSVTSHPNKTGCGRSRFTARALPDPSLLQSATLVMPLVLFDCYIEETINLREATAPGVYLHGCHILSLEAVQLRTTGNVDLSGAFTARDKSYWPVRASTGNSTCREQPDRQARPGSKRRSPYCRAGPDLRGRLYSARRDSPYWCAYPRRSRFPRGQADQRRRLRADGRQDHCRRRRDVRGPIHCAR